MLDKDKILYSTSEIRIIEANSEHLNIVSPLFDAYRVFYKQKSNLSKSTNFLQERFKKKDSVIFLALDDLSGIGFTQLYFTFSSVNMSSFCILNDLFVHKDFRKKGVGEALLLKAQDYTKENGFLGLSLETGIDNPAQKLYEKLGWYQNSNIYHYFWPVK